MTAQTTFARPYGKAAFDYARQHECIAEWAGMLNIAVTARNETTKPSSDSRVMTTAIQNSHVMTKQAVTHFENFIQLLGENGRLDVLPEIAALFEHYRAEHEKRIEVKITSAFELDQATHIQLETALKKRLQRDIVLRCDVNSDLLGGAVIHVGDQVIDGSARGALTRLGETLCRRN